jgi:hypothetical protein
MNKYYQNILYQSILEKLWYGITSCVREETGVPPSLGDKKKEDRRLL